MDAPRALLGPSTSYTDSVPECAVASALDQPMSTRTFAFPWVGRTPAVSESCIYQALESADCFGCSSHNWISASGKLTCLMRDEFVIRTFGLVRSRLAALSGLL